jgi:hypothetical protein
VAGTAQRRSVSPTALKGVTIGVPPVADARSTPGIGCGQLAQDLATRAHKLLVVGLNEAGAQETLSDRAPVTLKVTLREAGMGLENAAIRRTDKPVEQGPADAPPLSKPGQSIFNSGNENAQVSLEATLEKNGSMVWTRGFTGYARSGACVEATEKVREALQDAVDALRADLVSTGL